MCYIASNNGKTSVRLPGNLISSIETCSQLRYTLIDTICCIKYESCIITQNGCVINDLCKSSSYRLPMIHNQCIN